MIDLRLDVRDAWRALRRAPGAAIVAAVTLGLGVAATAAVYGVVYGILLKPVAGMRADGVFIVDQQNPRIQWCWTTPSTSCSSGRRGAHVVPSLSRGELRTLNFELRIRMFP